MKLGYHKAYSIDSYFYYILLISVLSVFVIQACFPENRLYYGPDSSFHYARIEALLESLKDGRFPVYIDYTRANGYGYGAKLFYSDLILLPVALLTFIFDLSVSFKIYLFFIFLLSGHFTYQAIHKLFKSNYISLIASLLITFSHYKLYSLSYRGALGEILSYVFIPIVVIGTYELIKGNYKKWYIFSLGFALLLMSHLLTSLLTGLFLVPFFFFYIKSFFKEKQRLKYLIFACFGVLLLASYGILPMLEQLCSNEFFLKTQSSWASPAQTKLSIDMMLRGLLTGLPSTGGIRGVGFLITLLLASRFFIRKVQDRTFLRIGDLCLVIGFILLILISEITPWGRMPFTYLSIIQFPWRLLEYATFLWSVSIAIYMSYIFGNRKGRLNSFLCVLLLQIIAILFYANDYRKHNSIEESFLMPGLGAVEYLPLRLQEGNPSYWYLIKQGEKTGVRCKYESTVISENVQEKSQVSFDINTFGKEEQIEIPLFYYKGYTVQFHGKMTSVNQSDHGLVEIVVSGKGEVVIDFTGTFIQKYSFYITVFGFLFVIVYAYWIRRKGEGL